MRDIAAVARGLHFTDQERVYALHLNAAGDVASIQPLSVGVKDSAPVPLEKLAEAISQRRSAGVVLVHNHPSGNLGPSAEDIAVTRTLRGKLPLRAHYVVANGKAARIA